MRKAACFGWFLFLLPALAGPSLAEIQISVGADDCSGAPGPSTCLGGTYVDSGTTRNAGNTVTQVNAGCFQRTAVPGADVVYIFRQTFASPTLREIRVTPESSYDVAIYLVGPGPLTAPCPAGPNAVIGSCGTGADAGGPGVTEIIPLSSMVTLFPGDYYLFIDSAAVGPSSSGSYTLSVDLNVCPVELMEYSIE